MLQNNVSKIPYFYQGWESYLGFLGFLGALGPNHIENSLTIFNDLDLGSDLVITSEHDLFRQVILLSADELDLFAKIK